MVALVAEQVPHAPAVCDFLKEGLVMLDESFVQLRGSVLIRKSSDAAAVAWAACQVIELDHAVYATAFGPVLRGG